MSKQKLITLKSRLCCDRDEIVNHIISEWSKLIQKEYKNNHHWVKRGHPLKIKKETEIRPYRHNSEFVLDTEIHTTLEDLHTDH